ncbi:hypothetical protein ACHAWF_003764 [Thalassiosira exigua]
MANPYPPSVEIALLPTAHGAQIPVPRADALGQQPALLVAAISTLGVKPLGHLPPEHPPMPPVVELLRHRHRRDVIPVEPRRVLAQVGEDHAAAARVTSPPSADPLNSDALRSRGVVEVGRGGDARAGEGSAGGVARWRDGGESGPEDCFVGQQAQDAS